MFNHLKNKQPNHFQIARNKLEEARIQLLEAEATAESSKCSVMILTARVERLRKYVHDEDIIKEVLITPSFHSMNLQNAL